MTNRARNIADARRVSTSHRMSRVHGARIDGHLPEPGGAMDTRGGADRGRRAWILVACALGVAVALRFAAWSPLWLDEAQSVAIARLPIPQLFDALRADGSSPLYYLLLHAWMQLFGDGAVAARAMSGVISVLSLPLGFVLGRRLAGASGGIATLLLLAASPFAIRYATETRMYSLLVLLTLAGGFALDAVRRRPGPRSVLGVAVVTAALLLTHYWSIFLLVAVGALAVARVVLSPDRHPRYVLAGLALGTLGFLPWLPSFLYQRAHTGAPWASRPGSDALVATVRAWAGAPTLAGELLYLLMVTLVVAALFVRRVAGRRIVLELRAAPVPATLLLVTLGTVALGVAVASVGGTAYVSRYTAVALVPFLLVLALGVCALPARSRLRRIALTLAVCLGLLAAAPGVVQPRTQAGQAAAILANRARPGDLVVSCPDQLGPAIARLAPSWLRLAGYPTLRRPDRVDWVDYAQRNAAADPATIAARILADAPTHTVWLATASGYRSFGHDCEQLALRLQRARPDATVVMYQRKVLEREQLLRFPPP